MDFRCIPSPRATEYGFDLFLTYVIGFKEMHNICCFVFNKEDPEQVERMHELMKVCIDDGAKLGFGEYRTHLGEQKDWVYPPFFPTFARRTQTETEHITAFMDQIAGTYNWNNNAIGKLNETLKDAMDPNGILAPGKSGIWPKRYRGMQL